MNKLTHVSERTNPVEAETTVIINPKIVQDLQAVKSLLEGSTGELVITPDRSGAPVWKLYFYLGRLVYATGGSHRVRRWYRALKQHAPNLALPEVMQSMNGGALTIREPWEMQLVGHALSKTKLTLEQAKAIIQASTQEVFYALIEQKKAKLEWMPAEMVSFQPVMVLSLDSTFQSVIQVKQKWQDAGLGHVQNMIQGFSFELSPTITNPERLQQMVQAEALSADAHQMLTKLLNGNNTLWDLSLRMKRSMVAVMRSLLPLVVDGIVEFGEIPDLASPLQALGKSTEQPNKKLIACIDDSPQIGQEMSAILSRAGYEVITILDPLQGVSTLLQRKPDLIFLDLVMPNTNGYELCTFLRKSATFQDVPIIILTGRDGMIDRVRAKIAGSTDFLSKPPETSKVLQMVDKYLVKVT
ncbi:MAG: response regulator [Pseudanabaenaceae cyanobacterium bins.68]|nr:response regulator [Pseudanabaenaceae cyanobacterium bins.68]